MKAILVINEMPTKCEGCPLHYRKRQDIYRCEMTHKNIRLNNKPSWCPLKPLPTKITTATLSEREQERTELFTSMAMLKTYADGWNDCLKEITDD